MATVAPLSGGEAITPAPMNALFSGLDGRMNTLLGGRSPLLAFPGTSAYPPVLFGPSFFFTSGRTAFAQRCPKASVFTTTATDPISGGVGNVSGVRPYDSAYHQFFINAATAGVIASYDTTKHIATIGEIGQGAYPPGLTLLPGTSLFEHSLEAHTKMATGPGDTAPRKYWLKETNPTNAFRGGHWPTKRYDRALAEMIVEGMAAVTIPARYDKHACFRWHNLQDRILTVTYQNASLPDFVFTIPAFGCRTVRRTWNGTAYENYRHGQFKYFFTYENSDPRQFWYFTSLPGEFALPTMSGSPFSSSDGLQGNNLTCPTILYEWLKYLTDRNNHAYFVRDPHEVMDLRTIVPEFVEKFGDPAVDTTKLGDLLHHKGKFTIVRRSKTITDDGVPRTTFTEAEFKGYATIVADFAVYQIQVTTNVDGDLELLNIDPDNNVDLIPHGTNFLKLHVGDGEDSQDFIVPTAVNIDTARKIENRIFENTGAATQDADGVANFNLRQATSYRVTQRSVNSEVNSRFWREPDGITTQVSGENWQTLEEFPVLADGEPFNGLHTVTVADLKTMRWNGDASLPSQNTPYSWFLNQVCKLTPEGLVMLFDELADASVLPDLSVGSYSPSQFGPGAGRVGTWNPVTGIFTGETTTPYYQWGRLRGKLGAVRGYNSTSGGLPVAPVVLELVHANPHPYGQGAAFVFFDLAIVSTSGATNYHSALSSTGWVYDLALDKWKRKHCLRFRKHGWGFGQFGKHYAAHFSPLVGRLRIRGYSDEVSGVDGADYSFPIQGESETGVKVLRRISTTELGSVIVPGGRFFVPNMRDTMDGLLAFLTHHQESRQFAGQTVYQWYHDNRGALLGGYVVRNSPDNVLLGMPLCSEHYNAMAQAVNQLKTGKLLSWKAIKIIYGNKVLDLATLTKWNEPTANGAGPMFSRSAPAPIDAYIPIDRLIQLEPGLGFNEDITAYWMHYLNAKGIYVATTAANLPASVAAFKTQDHFTRVASTTVTVRVTNATFAGAFQVIDNPIQPQGSNWWWASYNADVTSSMSNWQWSGATTIPADRGFAFIQRDFISPDRKVLGANLEGRLLRVNLNTAYPATMRWLRYSDFVSFAALFGVHVNEPDSGIPLVLDRIKINPVFANNAFTPSSVAISTHLGSHETGNGSTTPLNATSPDVVLRLNILNGPDRPGVNVTTAVLSNTFATDRIVFRLANDESEAASGFKVAEPSDVGNDQGLIAGTEPLQAFYSDSRTAGRIRIASARTEGWAFGFSSYNLVTAGQPQNAQGVRLTVPPFTDTQYDYDFPYAGALAGWGGSGVRFIGASYLEQTSARVVYSNPVRLSGDIEIPADSALRAQQDNYAAFVNYERAWYFVKLVKTAGVTASKKFYVVPQGHWGKVTDWWLQDLAHYDQSQYEIGQDQIPVAGLGAMIDRDVAPPAWVPVNPLFHRRILTVASDGVTTEYPPGAGLPPASQPLANGYAILKPARGEMVKIVYDPETLADLT